MPQQLIYTSAPRGVVAGRSGHCTVARSAAMREALVLQLEKLSYYQHLSLSGGQERPIYSCRVVDIRGSRYHVLSRIQDAGLDFTGRTNFLAHHLVLTPEEVRQFPSPPVILRGWSGWVQSWSKEPQLLENEDWSGLAGLSGGVSVPARNWQQITGDAVNGYGLLESRSGIAFRVDNLTEEKVLALFAESLELLELRDPRHDFRATAWQYTFTTSMQEQDNPADFRWRCLHSDNPASNRFAGPDCCPLSDVRTLRVTTEETMFARSGRQPPRFVIQPQNVRSSEGETARLYAKAEGIPSPSYQWFAVDRAGNGQVIANGTDAELVVQNPPLGQSRYVVRASNSQGDVTSEVVTLSVEQKLRLSQPHPGSAARALATTSGSHQKSQEDIERQRRRLEAGMAEAMFIRLQRRKKVRLISAVALVFLVLGGLFWWQAWQRRSVTDRNATESSNTGSLAATSSVDPNAKRPAPDGTNGSASLPGSLSRLWRWVADRNATKSSNALASPTNSTGVPTTNTTAAAGTNKSLTPLQDTDGTKLSESENPERGTHLPPPDKFPLPEGWMPGRIGTATNFNTEYHPPRFDLSAAAEGFAAKGDSAWFVYKTNITKDFQATLISPDLREPRPPGSVCGVMARESDKADAAFFFIGASPTKIITYRRHGAGKFDSKTNNIPQAKQNKPIFFRIQMDDKHIVPSYSFDAKTWLAVGQSNAVSRSGTTMVGLVICSGSSSNKVVAKFGGVLEQ